MNKKLIVPAVLLASSLSACGALYTPNPMHEGHIAVMADAKGMRSFMDGMNGFITNGKATPDKDTAHWIHRKNEDREHTIRQTSPGFLDKLFSRPAQTPSNDVEQGS